MKIDVFLCALLLTIRSTLAENINTISNEIELKTEIDKVTNSRNVFEMKELDYNLAIDKLLQFEKKNGTEFKKINKQTIVTAFPDSSILACNHIPFKDIDSSALNDIFYWTTHFIQPYLSFKYVAYKNTRNGDDCIIGFGSFEGEDITLIIGRTLSMIIEKKNKIINEVDKDSIESLVREYIKIMKFNNVFTQPNRINKQSDYLMYLYSLSCFTKSSQQFGYKDKAKYPDSNIVVLSNNLLLVDLCKINPPYYIFQNPPTRVVYSIPRKDSRSFIIFNNNKEIDFRKEMLNIYPNIEDDLKEINAKKQASEAEEILKIYMQKNKK